VKTWKGGWHLGNVKPPTEADWQILQLVPPAAITFLTHDGASPNGVLPEHVRRVLEISSGCACIMRPYYPAGRALQDYIDDCRRDMDAYGPVIPAGQRIIQPFNEQNMPRWSQYEGFGDQTEDMPRFDDWFCQTYNALKAHDPAWRVGWTPLTPGNRDMWFPGDPTGVPYYMHGPEAAHEGASGEEIAAAVRSGPCRRSLELADVYLAHAYCDDPGAIAAPWGGMRWASYLRFLPRPIEVYIAECAMWTASGAGHNDLATIAWLRLIAGMDVVKGTTFWVLGSHWGNQWAPDGRPRELVHRLAALRLELLAAAPTPGPTQPPAGELEQALRHAAWNAGGIPYNPEAAFPRYAREHGLGNPVTPEFDFGFAGQQYRGQGYSKGIVYCRVGDWSNIQQSTW